MLDKNCFVEGNTMTISWDWSSYGACGCGSFYALEIDDGFGGEFVVSSGYLYKQNIMLRGRCLRCNLRLMSELRNEE